MLVSCELMRSIEESAFAAGVLPGNLMDLAGLGLAHTVHRLLPRPGHVVAFLGKGNNAGDALVALHHLEEWGWTIEARHFFPVGLFSPLASERWARLQPLLKTNPPAPFPRQIVQLDGLVGIGSSGGLRFPLDAAAREMNRNREQGALTVAVDLPSGLDGETGCPNAETVVADCTVTFGYVKSGLVTDAAVNNVGRIELIPLPELGVPRPDAPLGVNTPVSLRPLLRRRSFDTHKGQAGRVGIFAGSRGFTGAAVLASSGALRAGAGLVTLFAEESIYEIVAAKAAPEVMVHPVRSVAEIRTFGSFDVFGVGPGLGRSHDVALRDWIRTEPRPMVVDADALTAIAPEISLLLQTAGPRLLTPHPGEFRRLLPHAPANRLEASREFVARLPDMVLLLKGARTLISSAVGSSFNTTGHPGMATGGMGDVLTGVIAALVGQRYGLYDSARIGAWVCGRAAELAIQSGENSQESLTPSCVLEKLGAAFCELHG